MKYTKSTISTMLILFGILAGIGYATANIGRFTPTHAIVEPVFCGSCHPDQIQELNATTHLPHFTGAAYVEAEAIAAGTSNVPTQAEAVSGGCMMCHNTWNNRDRIFLTNLTVTDDPATNNTILSYNDISVNPTNASVRYDVAITNSTTQTVRLGGSIVTTGSLAPKVTVQDPGSSGLAIGTVLTSSATTTSVIINDATNLTALNGTTPGAVKITYAVTGPTVSYKDTWGQLSGLSPQPGYFLDDQSGKASCGNPEKGMCHAVEITMGKNLMNQLQENTAGANGAQLGSGNGIYFQHDMSYTSAEYAAKQVKLCGVCHVNKLPPMDANGEPLSNAIGAARLVRVDHGTNLIDTVNVTVTSPAWAHRQVQCIRCHSHAGISKVGGNSGVISP